MTHQPQPATSDLRHPWTRRQLLEGFAATFAAVSAIGGLRSPLHAQTALAATAADPSSLIAALARREVARIEASRRWIEAPAI